MANKTVTLPFRQGTRRHRMVLDNVSHSNGTTLESVEIKPAGWLAGLIVTAALSVTTGSGPSWGDKGPWGIVKRFNLEVNGQTFQPIDIDGYSAYIMQYARVRGGAPDRAHLGSSGPNSNFYLATLAANTTQTVNLTWFLPLSLNLGANFETGLLPLLARELSAYLKISTDSLANLGTNITGITGTWKTTAVYFNDPVPISGRDGITREFQRPAMQGVRLISMDTTIKADNSDTAITLPREGTIAELAHIVRVNGARADYYDNCRLVLGNSNVQDRADKAVIQFENALQYGELPTGVFFHQISDDYEGNIKGLRDGLDTTGISLAESVIAINTSGAGLGASNNLITSAMRIISAYDYRLG